METRILNIRNVPEELARRAKAAASLRGISFQEFVIEALRAAVEKDSKSPKSAQKQ
jgi:predicted HicB family RNase H-like nuclease